MHHRFSNGIAFNPPPQIPLYAVPPSAKDLWNMKIPVTDVNEKGVSNFDFFYFSTFVR